jgi:GNAT superfamily N-acetyltransferase
MRVRLGTASDQDLFIELWTEFLEENHKQGNAILPTERSLRFFLRLFRAYTSARMRGVAVFGADDNAVTMYGEVSDGELYDTEHGLVAQNLGFYVRPKYRSQGIAKRMRDLALRALRRKGFDSTIGSRPVTDDRDLLVTQKGGSEPYQVSYVLRI